MATITLVGVILSFIVGSAGLWIGIRNSRKTIFINSVTTARIKYIQDLRAAISEFCGLFYSYHALHEGNSDFTKEKLELLTQSDKLKYLIKLHLNPEDEYWDREMLKLIDEIRMSIKENPAEKINKLIAITQYLLKLEWEGAKRESQKGILSKREKGKLYNKYVRLYKQHMQNQLYE